MSNINIKLILKEIYPLEFFKKFEAIEIIIKEIKGNEEQQKVSNVLILFSFLINNLLFLILE